MRRVVWGLLVIALEANVSSQYELVLCREEKGCVCVCVCVCVRVEGCADRGDRGKLAAALTVKVVDNLRDDS